jgi:two-component system, chemotaxis family, sensor kinase CheA
VGEVDPELRRLLVMELTRHLATLDGDDAQAARRALHAMKGSAGLAGERELAEAFQRVERRVRDGDPFALADASHVARTAVARLSQGNTAVVPLWPEPPDDMVAVPVDPSVREHYASDVLDHLTALDRALEITDDPVEAVATVFRHVHTIKGAASSVKDEPMTWFCHGLEERLRVREPSPDVANAALAETAKWRGTLSALLTDPDGALRTLRSPGSRQRASEFPSKRPSTRPPLSDLARADDEQARAGGEDATIRVAAASVDRLLDRLASIGVVRERIAGRVESSREQSRELRRLRADLAEALRLIGPPRPWGAPAAALRRVEWTASALDALGDELDHAAAELRGGDQMLRESLTDAKLHLSAMRQTPLRRLFARLSTAIETEARRGDHAVIVRTTGADETIDRRLVEQLMEPCLQLARNAVAHGVESPEVRKSHGKPEVGTICLSARRTGQRLSITIEDDGAGVDVGAVRERAIEIGALAPALAEAADDNTLLALLFLPGFSTRKTSDLLAGRGVGLDITLGAIKRIGGGIRLSSRRGEGFAARIELPFESGLANVLWVAAGGEQYAVSSVYARAARKNEGPDMDRTPHLSACLEGRESTRAEYAVEIDTEGADAEQPFLIGVDEIGRTEDILIRPLTPLIAGVGPFSGAILRGDGSLRLALDVFALAPRARTLGRLPDRTAERPSRIPSRPPPPLA